MSSFKSGKPANEGMQTEGGAAITYEQVKTFLVFLTPILAPIGGFVSRWVAQHFPGGNLSPDQATTVFLAGVAAVVFALITLIVKDVLKGKPLTAIPGELENFVVGEMGKLPDGAEIEKLVQSEIEAKLPSLEALVKAHLPDIEAEIEAKLPAAASDALRQLLSQLGLQPVATTAPAPASVAQTPVQPTPAQPTQAPVGTGAAS